MSNKAKVLKKHKGAFSFKCGALYYIGDANMFQGNNDLYGQGKTPRRAWADAARRVDNTEKKS
jgi:hypothetical protein